MRYDIVGADEIVGEEYYEDEGWDDGYYDDVNGLLGAPQSLARVLARRGGGRPMRAPMRRPGRRVYSPAVRQARQVAAAIKTVDAGSIVRNVAPTKSRALVFGITSLAVPALGTVIVTVQPQVLFRPQRLIIPATIAPSFVVNDIIIGNKSQFATAGAVPAEAWTQNADMAPTMLMDTLGISMNFTLNITSVAGAPTDFRAAIFGEAVE